MRSSFDDDEGSTLILTIFYAVLALSLVLIVAAATSLYLEKKQLLSLADSAALVGAEAFSLSDVSADDGGPTVSLHSVDVNDAVAGFLAEARANGFDGLAVEQAASLDGVSATVTLSSHWRPPVVTLFLPDGIRIEATSVARSVLQG